MDEYFNNLQDELNDQEHLILSLVNFKEKLSIHSCFDEEDMSMIDKRLKQETQRLRDMNETFKSKTELYNKEVVAVEGRVKEREKVLGSENAINDHPDLLEYFLKKQEELVNVINEVKDRIKVQILSSV
jgi:lipid II:glycine glycyltransferase (peptidoglycan interpeptide bridge formation enzyme)